MTLATPDFCGEKTLSRQFPHARYVVCAELMSRVNGQSPIDLEIGRLNENTIVYLSSFARQLQTPYVVFDQLARAWEEETEYYSSTPQMVLHPAYQKIIAMGKEALPLILNRLQSNPNHWFWALEAITGVNPVPASQNGNFEEMVEAWTDWGKVNGYFR